MSATDVSRDIKSAAEYLGENIAKLPKNFQEAANSLTLCYSQRPHKFTDKQKDFVFKLVDKLKTPVAKKQLGSFERVVELFDKAKKKQKYPKLRLQLKDGQKVVLSVAGPNANFPGTINVSDGGPFGESIFFGRVTKEGQFEEKNHRSGITELLQDLACDPLKVAKSYGKLTGICCCCGRELTDPVSIEAGIGSWCAAKWCF